jgi:phage protein D
VERLKQTAIIIYQGRDVTGDLAPILKGVTFRDHLDGKAGELDIDLNNSSGLFLWDWFPDVNDRISVMIGFETGLVMDCGAFWVDEVKLTGGASGDSCSIRGLSLPSLVIYAPEARCNYENRPIEEIVNGEAEKLGYKVVGDLSGTWSGLQQETGLQFINRLAHETGRILKIENDTLIFYLLDDLLSSGAFITIDSREVISYDISDKAAGRISKCTVKWWDRTTKREFFGSYDAKIKGGGSALIWEEVKNNGEAASKAADYIKDRNKKGVEFTLNMEGDVRLRAGVAVETSGFGRFDSLYIIGEATHSVSDGGYTTRIKLQRPEAKKKEQ